LEYFEKQPNKSCHQQRARRCPLLTTSATPRRILAALEGKEFFRKNIDSIKSKFFSMNDINRYNRQPGTAH
jgi:hypothetical protein